MFNNKTAYALNKMDPDSIIYIAADDSITRLTRQDFASEDEFRRWKEWSDAEYHAAEKAQHLYNNHTLAMELLPEQLISFPSAEMLLDLAYARVEQLRRSIELVQEISGLLTEKQFRRLWLCHVDGLTVREIAKQEGVSYQRISKAILEAEKKISDYLQNTVDKGPTNRR